MINIVLLCAGGMSTSILAKNIEEAALELGFECKVLLLNSAKMRASKKTKLPRLNS